MNIPPGLLQAFHDTNFNVEGLGIIRIGYPVPVPLRAWMDMGGVTQIAVLGAENPWAMQVDDAVNDARHAALIEDCHSRGYQLLHVIGTGESWQERHVLVANMSRDLADDFRRRYDQVAVLHATLDGVVDLILDVP